MKAIVRTGGKQFRVEKGDVLRVPLMEAEPGSEVELTEVLQVSAEDGCQTGQPVLANASVKAKVLRHGRGNKILVYTFKRRKGFEKRSGHRQDFTEIQIGDIVTDGA
ncbi:MAG: 50S ribosomal protein L21 [bacterium]|nr:50S ribosomal protein L21 [Candidatus Sumerlaeota bacterium]